MPNWCILSLKVKTQQAAEAAAQVNQQNPADNGAANGTNGAGNLPSIPPEMQAVVQKVLVSWQVYVNRDAAYFFEIHDPGVITHV